MLQDNATASFIWFSSLLKRLLKLWTNGWNSANILINSNNLNSASSEGWIKKKSSTDRIWPCGLPMSAIEPHLNLCLWISWEKCKLMAESCSLCVTIEAFGSFWSVLLQGSESQPQQQRLIFHYEAIGWILSLFGQRYMGSISCFGGFNSPYTSLSVTDVSLW